MSIDSNYLKSYLFSFEGRARRLEYWMYHLFLMIVFVLFVVFSGLMAVMYHLSWYAINFYIKLDIVKCIGLR